jgi:transcriptional regulator with XRE-family HTH domain
MPITPRKSADPDPIDVVVGKKLRKIRKSRAYSQADLASALGVTFQQIQRYEYGLNRISVSVLVRAALSLQISPSDLLPDLSDFSPSASANI